MAKLERFTRTFQKHVAATMCRTPYVMSRLSAIVTPDLFDDTIIGDVLAFGLSHYKTSKELISKTSMLEAFKEKEERRVIRELWKEDISDPEFVIENVVDFVRQQSVEKAVTEAAHKIDRGEHDNIVDLMRDALQIGEDFGNVGEFFHQDFDTRERAHTHPESIVRVRTGLSHLDTCMGGGLASGELGVFLGPPKSGKSMVLVNVGVGAAAGVDGVNVVHYSLEMSPRKINMRYDYRVAGSKINLLRDENPREFVKQLRRRKKRIVGGEILVKGYGTRKASVSNLRSHLNLVRSYGFDFGLVIVDYGDIMKAERRIGEFRHEQAGIYEDLRGLGDEFGVPIWTGCQANRGSLEKEIVTMADVAESFEKIAIADCVVAICRTGDEIVKNQGRLFIAALRENQMGRVIECNFNMKNSLIRTLDVNDPVFTKKRRKKKLTKDESAKKRSDAVLKSVGE